jgi:hypothetical protein
MSTLYVFEAHCPLGADAFAFGSSGSNSSGRAFTAGWLGGSTSPAWTKCCPLTVVTNDATARKLLDLQVPKRVGRRYAAAGTPAATSRLGGTTVAGVQSALDHRRFEPAPQVGRQRRTNDARDRAVFELGAALQLRRRHGNWTV